jgi:hypothetical protein
MSYPPVGQHSEKSVFLHDGLLLTADTLVNLVISHTFPLIWTLALGMKTDTNYNKSIWIFHPLRL